MTAVQACTLHPESPSIGDCDVCYRPYCSDCSVQDISTETTYCSNACRERVSTTFATSEREFAAASKAPIRAGWRLWLRALPQIALHSVPVAALIAGLIVASGSSVERMLDEESSFVVSLPVQLACWLVFAYGIALTATILSKTYLGESKTSPYSATAKRFLAWLATWALVLCATVVGFLLLVVPGIIVGIRLFWADEFALVHSAGPMTACRESIALTKGRAGVIYGFQFRLGLAEYLVLIPAALLYGFILGLSALMPSPATSFAELLLLLVLAFVVYGSAHAAQIVYFYGLRARQAEASA